jgi:hypothetical protein
VFADGTLRRRLALIALAERRLHENYLGRAASFYGWGVAVSYALLIAVAPASAWPLFERALVTAGGIVGALAGGAALRDAWGRRNDDALGALARGAGFGGSAVQGLRAAGAVWRALKAIGAPAALLAVFGLGASLLGGRP